MANFEIDPIMMEILNLFQEEGNLTTGALVTRTERSRLTVTKRLDKLRAGGYVEYVDEPTALHRLIEDPREEGETTQTSLEETTNTDEDN
jgi:Mn-dependent DtxR family transcriptional regulator